MKRLAPLFLFLIALGLFGYLLTVNLQPRLDATDFLPVDTVALVESRDLARTWEAMRQSSIGRKLNKPDFPRILEQLGLPASRVSEFRLVTAALDRFTTATFFTGFFAKNTVVALLSESQGQVSDAETILRNLVLITPLRSDFSPQRQLEHYFGPVQSTATTVYQGVSLVTLIFQSGRTFSFCQHRRLLICALDPKSVQRCIDQSLNRMVQTRSGLQLNQEYQGIKKRAGGKADFFLYSDLPALLRQLPAALLAETEEIGCLPHHFAIFHQANAEHDRLSIIAQFRQEQLTAFTDQYQLAAPLENAAGQRISRETQLYFWTNWFNPKRLWHLGLQTGGRETVELMSFIAQQIFEKTGTAIDDFFDVFGNRFGVFMNEQGSLPQTTQSIAGLFIEVRDQQKVEVMLKQLLAGLQLVKVITGGTEIVSVIMAGGLLSPAYALVDNHLILADSVGLIEQVQRQGGLKPASVDKALVPARDRADNIFLFVRTKRVAQRLIALLTVLTKETADPTKFLLPSTRLMLEHALIPLLMSLQSVETSSVRGYALGDEMLLEMDFSASSKDFRIF